MKNNMGTLDRIARVLAATVGGIFIAFGFVTGLTAIIIGIFSAVLLFTSVVRFCPLYLIPDISTNKSNS